MVLRDSLMEDSSSHPSAEEVHKLQTSRQIFSQKHQTVRRCLLFAQLGVTSFTVWVFTGWANVLTEISYIAALPY